MTSIDTSTLTGRRHDLDWLRIGAFAVLIFYHVGMFYVTWDWHLSSDHSSGALEPVMALVNPWRLALLFFISGVAIRFVLDARAPRAVVSERLGRLLLPLGFGMLIVVVPQAYLELRAAGEVAPGFAAFYPHYLSPVQSFSLLTPTWNHLWYLPYILVYTLLIAAGLRVLHLLRRRFGPAARAMLVRAPWAVLVAPALPLITYALLLDPRFPTTHAMVDDWANHAHSLTMVLTGWFAAKSGAFWAAVERVRVPACLTAVILGGLLAVVWPHRANLTMAGATTMTVVRTWFAWAVIVALLALGQRLLNRPSPVLTYATEAVLPWYILHQSLIVILGYQFLGSGAPLGVEAPVVVLGTVAGCLLLHELLIRRVPLLRRLFGLKRLGIGQPRRPRHPGRNSVTQPPSLTA